MLNLREVVVSLSSTLESLQRVCSELELLMATPQTYVTSIPPDAWSYSEPRDEPGTTTQASSSTSEDTGSDKYYALYDIVIVNTSSPECYNLFPISKHGVAVLDEVFDFDPSYESHTSVFRDTLRDLLEAHPELRMVTP